MPLYNVVKKMNKAAQRLGFPPGETVVAGAMTFPRGHKLESMKRAMVGGIGATLQRSGHATDAGHASLMPNGQHFVAVTNRRLVATTVKSVSTNPKDVVAEWPLEVVRNIAVERHTAASAIAIYFADGSVLELDGMHGSGAADLHDILGH